MINLLPPQYKSELIQEEKYKLSLILGIIFLIFLISLILILFAIEIYLTSQVEVQKILIDFGKEQLKTPEITEFKEKITLANQNLLKLDTFYQGQFNLTEILEKVSETLPSGAYLNNLFYQKENSQIRLSGFASNRETLFEFKQNLDKEEGFTEVDFPASNWLKPVGIEFNVSFKLK